MPFAHIDQQSEQSEPYCFTGMKVKKLRQDILIQRVSVFPLHAATYNPICPLLRKINAVLPSDLVSRHSGYSVCLSHIKQGWGAALEAAP